MNLLQKIASKFKGSNCERLVQTKGQEFKINLGVEGGGVKFNIAEFSNTIKELVEVPEISLHLDDTQYLLCKTISSIKGDTELKNKCIAMRLQLILAFSQLTTLLASIKQEPTEDLKNKLSKWLRYMDSLHRHGISTFNPSKKVDSKADIPLPEILKFQGIDDQELKDAVANYRS